MLLIIYFAICLAKNPVDVMGQMFLFTGFRSWKKVNDGKNCAFPKHIGNGLCSPHNNAVTTCQDLLN